jgi:serine protease Do
MKRLLFACLAGWAILLAALTGAAAQSSAPASLDGVGGADLRVLQAALTLTGDYDGALDGAWGPQSRAALAAYVRREHGDSVARDTHLTALVRDFEREWRGSGWSIMFFPESGISAAQPVGLLYPDSDQPEHLTLRSRPDGLLIRWLHEPYGQTAAMHDWAQRNHRGDVRPFQVLGDQQMISKMELAGGERLYLRSEWVGRHYVTILVQAKRPHWGRLALVAASIRLGTQPDLTLSPDGPLAARLGPRGAPLGGAAAVRPLPRPEPAAPAEEVPPPEAPAPEAESPVAGDPVAEAPAEADADTPPEAEAETAPEPDAETADSTGPGGNPVVIEETPPEADAPAEITSSGTGFFVAPDAVVTAAHVVRGCLRVTLDDGTPLELIAEDPRRDLAVLRAETPSDSWLRLQVDGRPRLGQTVAAVGFPFYGLAGRDIVLTTGNISSILDAESAADRIMISAPVQPGNSGGPLLSAGGEVVGMVAARADDAFFLEATGTMPQDMNFAVRLAALRGFLEGAGVDLPGNGAEALPITEGLAEEAQAAIRPVLCYLPG